jgi:hypothetical protein
LRVKSANSSANRFIFAGYQPKLDHFFGDNIRGQLRP